MNIIRHRGGVLITLYVKPGSNREGFELNDEIVFHTRERAERGRANRALIKYLSKIFSIPASSISIVRGVRDRVKTVYIEGVDERDVVSKLMEYARRE